MSMNLSAKLDELQHRGDRHLETTVALCEIRSQLQELTKSVESCQSEVSEVKRDMVAIKQELDTVQQVKEEIEELREYVDRLEEHTHRRKLRLLEQVRFCVHLVFCLFRHSLVISKQQKTTISGTETKSLPPIIQSG